MSGVRIPPAELGKRVLALVADGAGHAQFGGKYQGLPPTTIIEIAAILLANPTISANAVAAQVPGRRQEVLRVVREIRQRADLVPVPGNRISAATPDTVAADDDHARVIRGGLS
jgi:hypothetical protein